MRTIAVRRIVLVVSLLSIAGCKTPLQGTLLPAADPVPRALVESLDQRAQSFTSVRGAADLSVDAPGVRFSRPQRFAAMRPDSLRFETLGLFGQIAGVLVTHEGRYQFFDGQQPGLQRGRVTPELLWQVAKVDFTVGEVVDLLLGSPPRAEGLRVGRAWRFADGSHRVELHDARGTPHDRLDFDAAGRLLGQAHLAPDGEMLWEVRFGDFRQVGETSFPFLAELRFVRTESTAVLRHDSVELNPELSPGIFVLQAPQRFTLLR